MKNITLLLLCGLVLATACKKDGSSSADAEAILTTGKWQLTAVSVSAGSFGDIDVFSLLEVCITDNLYTFAANGTATIDEGATKCDPNDPQTVSGNWELLSNNTKLKGIDPITGTDANFTILQLDNSTLKVRDTTTYNGQPTVATAVFTHIH